MTPEIRPFQAGAQRGELVIEWCPSCRRHMFPPRGYCAGCGGRALEHDTVTGPGTVYSFTVNWNSWQPGMPVPFALVLVEFPDAPGVRLLGRMHGDPIHHLAVGQAVSVGFEHGPGEVPVPCFAPMDGAP